jgi:hypothetical protein
MTTITLAEMWRLRGLVDAYGEDGAADRCGVTAREMCDAIYPGADEAVVKRIREKVARVPSVPDR